MRFLLLLALAVCKPAFGAGVDPDIQWKVLKTAHFEFVYKENLKEVAELYAREAEMAYEELLPFFRETPEKTLIVLNDETDDVNGFASFLPDSNIVLYLNMPSSIDDISSYESWAHMLVLHEYTHILNMHASHGFYTPLKYIFGTIVRPNAALPTWYLEGLAVNFESRLTAGGRLRAPRTDSLFRAFYLGDGLQSESLDRLNELSIASWPGGRRPYILGGSLLKESFDGSGNSSVAYDLNQRYGRRVPFFLNGPARDTFGSSWPELWDTAQTKINAKVKTQIEQIKTSPVPKLQATHKTGSSQFSPSISPNQKLLAYISGDPHKGSSIRVLRREGKSDLLKGKVLREIRGSGFERMAWAPDSSGFVYTKMHVVSHYKVSSDLFFYDVNKNEITQLTSGARALEPEFSLDGKTIFYVVTGEGGSGLNSFDWLTKKSAVLRPRALNHRVSYPVALSDDELLFLERNDQGKDQAVRLNLSTKTETAALTDFSSISQAHKIKNGVKDKIYFVSEKSGVPNLYETDLQLQSASPLTNSLTSIVNGDLDAENNFLLVSQSTDKGPRLFYQKNPEPLTLTPVDSLFKFAESSNASSEAPKTSAESTNKTVALSEPEDYSTVKYLLPSYWKPFVYPAAEGVLIQGSTQVSDPLGKQGYNLDVGYETESKGTSFMTNYFNAMTSVDYNFYLGRLAVFYPSSGLQFFSNSAGLNSSFYISADNSWSAQLGLGYTKSETDAGRLLHQQLAPTAGVQYTSAGHFNVDPSENTFSAALHQQTSLALENYLHFERTYLNLSEFYMSGLPTQHLLSAQLNASYAPRMNLQDILFAGDTTLGGSYATNLINRGLLLRGYPSGTFSARSMAVANIDYTLPLFDLFTGWGSFPFFAQDIKLNFFVDSMMMDGLAYDHAVNRFFPDKWKHSFTGTGGELILTATTFYHFPLYFKLGVYYGFDKRFQGGTQTFFMVSFDEMGDLN